MNLYEELRCKQRREVESLPLAFAFGQKQFQDMLRNWNLTEDDCDQVLSLGAGAYIQRKDEEKLRVFDRHQSELREAIAAENGSEFACDMFQYELQNHEYGYTGDISDTLDALGFTLKQVMESCALLTGLNKASRKIIGRDAV